MMSFLSNKHQIRTTLPLLINKDLNYCKLECNNSVPTQYEILNIVNTEEDGLINRDGDKDTSYEPELGNHENYNVVLLKEDTISNL